MHRDHVPTLPPNTELLASSAVAPVQGMISRYPSGGIHILTVQGHPGEPLGFSDKAADPDSDFDRGTEFSPDIVSKIIDTREASGVLDAETVKEARIRAAKRDDGVALIGRACWQVLAPTDSKGTVCISCSTLSTELKAS